MVQRPKHVFTTCPKASGTVFKVSTENKIVDASGRELLIVKDRRISYEDAVKAAKCAGLKTFNVRKLGSTVNMEARDFPIDASIVIVPFTAPVSVPSVQMVSVRENKIFTAIDGKLLQIVKGSITKEHLDKAAKCAKFKLYTAHSTKMATSLSEFEVTSSSKFTCDVYIKEKIVEARPLTPSLMSDNKIMKADGTLLMVVKGPITLVNLERAAKCAKLTKYTAWKYTSGGPQLFPNSASKFDHNVYLRAARVKKTAKKMGKKTQKVISSKKQLLNKAIAALTELGKSL